MHPTFSLDVKRAPDGVLRTIRITAMNERIARDAAAAEGWDVVRVTAEGDQERDPLVAEIRALHEEIRELRRRDIIAKPIQTVAWGVGLASVIAAAIALGAATLLSRF